MAADSVLALGHETRAARSDPAVALDHLAALAGRLCPAPLPIAPPMSDIAAIGFGAKDAELALLILARGYRLRVIDPDGARLHDLLRRIALEQEYALWAGEISVPERERQWRAITCYQDIAAREGADLALWAAQGAEPDPDLVPDDDRGGSQLQLRLLGQNQNQNQNWGMGPGQGEAGFGHLFLRGRLAELAMPQESSLLQLQNLAQFLLDLGFCPMPVRLAAQHEAIAGRLAAKVVEVLSRLRSYGCDPDHLRAALDPVGLPLLHWDAAAPHADPPLTAQEIRQYYLNEILLFGRDLLRQGCITQLDALDLVAIHALGQPPQSGGPIYQARALGLCAPAAPMPARSRKSPPSARSRKAPALQD